MQCIVAISDVPLKTKSRFLARFALKIRIGNVNVEKLETSRLHNLLMAAVLEETFCPDACFRAEHGILMKEKGRFFQVRDVIFFGVFGRKTGKAGPIILKLSTKRNQVF